MKKLVFLIACITLFSTTKVRSQITLDTTINNDLEIGYGFKLVQVSASETKWYFADTLNNTFNLLNMDFTPFIMNIAVPEPFDPYESHMQVLYITRTLFDCDSSNIEYAYYSAANIGKPFRILRTDGTILLQRDSANGPYSYGSNLAGTDVIRPIVNTSSGAKLFLQPYPLQKPVYVYSLCGTLPTDIFNLTDFTPSFIRVFPNPALNALTFQIELPDNINEYELVILDNNAREVKREKINSQNKNLLMDMVNFSGGGYYYSLCSKDKTYQTGKFILTK